MMVLEERQGTLEDKGQFLEALGVGFEKVVGVQVKVLGGQLCHSPKVLLALKVESQQGRLYSLFIFALFCVFGRVIKK